jgi:8-oxo-dGTP pyrophosphatase MutT (NUDIX family)
MSGSPNVPVAGFRHLEDRLVHQGHVWHVAVARYESPEGEVFVRDVVRSPGAVAAVPLVFDPEGNPSVVFVRQYRPPFDEYVLEIPAGMRDVLDEPTEVTAGRELIEEVGLRAGNLVHLIDFYPSAGMTNSVLYLYLATDLEPVERETHGPEEAHSEVVHLPLATALEMVDRGEIHDAKSVIGLLLVDRRLRAADRAV